MTTITRELIQKLRAEMDAALKAVAEANGVVIQTGNATFNESSATFKIEIAAKNENEEVADVTELKAAANYRAGASLIGMKLEWLGKTAKTPKGDMELMGLMPRRTKFPVLVKCGGELQLIRIQDAIRAFDTV